MSTILDTLHDIVPSWGNVYFATDSRGNLLDICDERPEAQDVLPVYAGEFLNGREKEVYAGWPALQGSSGAVDWDRFITTDRRSFLKHDLYNEVLRPLGFFYGAHITLWEGSELRGYLQFQRGKTAGRFEPEELRRVNRVARFITHALADTAQSQAGLLVSPQVSQQGFIVADPEGRIQHLTRTARRLLYLSCFPSVARDSAVFDDVRASRLPPPIAGLCRTVTAIANEVLVPDPPSHVTRNTWGEFHYHAHLLESKNDDGSNSLIGISVNRFEPIATRVFKAVKSYGLTTRQLQTCVLLAEGLTAAQIAGRLGVRESTVVSHRKEIYGRLDAGNRMELLGRLIAN